MNIENSDIIKKPKDFIVGEEDNAKYKIESIYCRTPDFVIYRTCLQITVEIDDDSPKLEKLLENHGELSVETVRIQSWLPLKLKNSETFNRQIARALFENLNGNFELAKSILEQVEGRVKSLRIIKGRLQYALSGLILAATIFMAVVFLSTIHTTYPILSNYYYFLKIALCGSLGGILSMTIGFPSLEVDLDATFLTNCLIGSSRIIISIVAAFFSYFAIKSGIAFSFLANGEQEAGIYVAAMISGFSEMLIPNIMTNLTSKAEKE